MRDVARKRTVKYPSFRNWRSRRRLHGIGTPWEVEFASACVRPLRGRVDIPIDVDAWQMFGRARESSNREAPSRNRFRGCEGAMRARYRHRVSLELLDSRDLSAFLSGQFVFRNYAATGSPRNDWPSQSGMIFYAMSYRDGDLKHVPVSTSITPARSWPLRVDGRSEARKWAAKKFHQHVFDNHVVV